MATGRDLSSGWRTYEVYQRNEQGDFASTPFTDALCVSGTIPVQPITKMRMLEEIGWPTAKRRLKDDRGQPLVVKKDDVI
jgi:hypothetical protein